MRPPVPWLFLVLSPLLIAVVTTIAWRLAPSASAGGDFATGAGPDGDTLAQTGGRIIVSSSAITGQEGKALLTFAAPAAGGAPLARACAIITSASFTLPPTAMTDLPAGQDPCGETTPETVFAPGSYTVVAGVYTGGSQTPDIQTETPVEVTDADVNVVIDGSALSVPLTTWGDVDCDEDIDAVDALRVLRYVAELPLAPVPGCPAIGASVVVSEP